MNVNFDDVQLHQPIDALVHLGAGHCTKPDTCLRLQSKQLLLVEADPDLADMLLSRTDNLPQVEVSCAAVAGRPGTATFYRYNLPEAGSLHAASGMLQFFPRLTVVEQLHMETVSPVTLVQPLQLQVQQENHLVIDLPSEELPVLQVLHRAQQLHLFRNLRLMQCSREPLYRSGHYDPDIASAFVPDVRGSGIVRCLDYHGRADMKTANRRREFCSGCRNKNSIF
jgi:hypothetical protein